MFLRRSFLNQSSPRESNMFQLFHISQYHFKITIPNSNLDVYPGASLDGGNLMVIWVYFVFQRNKKTLKKKQPSFVSQDLIFCNVVFRSSFLNQCLPYKPNIFQQFSIMRNHFKITKLNSNLVVNEDRCKFEWRDLIVIWV